MLRNRIPRRPYARMGMAVPEKFLTKLRYTQTSTIDALPYNAAMGTNINVLRVNSIFDPDQTGTGHQPLWRDQIALMYNRYRVHGMKYVLSVNGNKTRMTEIALVVASNEAPEDKWSTACERKGTRIIQVPPGLSHTLTYTGFIRPGTPYGLTPRQMKADEAFFATMGLNPAKGTFMCIYVVTHDTTARIDYDLHLTYYVELFDKVRVDGS